MTTVRPQFISPNYLQLIALTSFFLCGTYILSFNTWGGQFLLCFSVACFTQIICHKLFSAGPIRISSALISAAGISILLRSNYWIFPCLATFLAIMSKFIFSSSQKGHLFNPGNFGIVFFLLFFSDRVWISSSQWGHHPFILFSIITIGTFVCYHAGTLRYALTYLILTAGMLFFRNMLIEDSFSIFVFSIYDASIFFFGFFMISDPKTYPKTLSGKSLQLTCILFVHYYTAFVLFKPYGFIWGLFVSVFFLQLWERHDEMYR